jgi:putative transposase
MRAASPLRPPFASGKEVMTQAASISAPSARKEPLIQRLHGAGSAPSVLRGAKGDSMARRHYNEELRRRVLQEVQDGATVGEVAHRYGIAEATYYRWRERLRAAVGMTSPETQRLEDENRRLRDILTDTMLENRALRQEVDRLRKSGANAGDD